MKPSSDKKTSVFPQGHIDRSKWKRVRLGELVAQQIISMGRGNVISKETIESNPGCYPVFSSSATGDGIIGHYAEYMFDDERISWSIDGGGKFFYHPISRYSVTDVSGWIKVHKQDEISTRFLYLALDAEWQTKHFDYQTKAHPSVIKNEYTVIYPAIDKQHEITTTIASCENHIAALQALITKYEAIKKATVNLLLKAKVGWRKVKIKDFCPLQRGFDLPKRLRSEGRYPLVCSNGIVDRIDTALQKAPGVVTGRSGTIGSVHYVTEDYWPHNTTLWVTKFIDADPMFVYHLLSNMNLSSFSGGSGVPTLNRNSIHETIISVPTIHKQREIALQISAIDNVLKDCRVLLAKAQSLKQGMMSYFFG